MDYQTSARSLSRRKECNLFASIQASIHLQSSLGSLSSSLHSLPLLVLSLYGSSCVYNLDIHCSTTESVKPFYDTIEAIIEEWGLEARDLIAMDETGISGESAPKERVIVSSDETRAYNRTTAFQKHTTMTHICRGNGQSLPPIFFLEDKSGLPEDMDVSSAPPGSLFTAQKKGYLEGEHMKQVLEHIINHTKDAERLDEESMSEDRANRRDMLLVIDGASQHLANNEAIDLAFANRIGIVILPHHTSHLTQVSDLSCFRPFKEGWSKAQLQFHSDHPDQAINNSNIVSLLSPVWKTATREENVISGFKRSGIWPFNPSVVLDVLPTEADLRAQCKAETPTPPPATSISFKLVPADLPTEQQLALLRDLVTKHYVFPSSSSALESSSSSSSSSTPSSCCCPCHTPAPLEVPKRKMVKPRKKKIQTGGELITAEGFRERVKKLEKQKQVNEEGEKKKEEKKKERAKRKNMTEEEKKEDRKRKQKEAREKKKEKEKEESDEEEEEDGGDDMDMY